LQARLRGTLRCGADLGEGTDGGDLFIFVFSSRNDRKANAPFPLVKSRVSEECVLFGEGDIAFENVLIDTFHFFIF
jgi:hypothetical protein